MFGPVHRNYSFLVLQDKLKEIVFFLKSIKDLFWGNSFNLIIFLYSSSPSSHLLCSSTNEKHFIQNNIYNNNWNILFGWLIFHGSIVVNTIFYMWTQVGPLLLFLCTSGPIKMLIRENYLIYIHISTIQCSKALNPISLVTAPLVCEGGHRTTLTC